MKIAYGTYATPMMPLEDSLRMMANIGYEGVEIAISPKHIMPESFASSQRNQLKNVLEELNFVVPGFLVLGGALSGDEDTHRKRLRLIGQVIELAKDIGARPVISTGSGGNTAGWDTQKNNLVHALEDYANIASKEGAIIAVEPHVHAMVDRSERALWLLKTMDSPCVRLHFDIVHLFLAREPIRETVQKLVPYTAHTHITDAKIADSGFEFVLLGTGELDCAEYMRAMKDAGWDDFITIEVSAMVWSKEGYDPVAAAELSYETISNAFEAACVTRG